MTDFELQIRTNGPVGEAAVQYAEAKLRRLARYAPRPVLSARVILTAETNPALERPAIAKGTLAVGGRPVRAHVAAGSLEEAIDLLERRLRRRLEVLSGHREAKRTRTGVSEPGEWRHGSLPAERPDYFPRPEEEREVIRHKTYELAPMTAEEAGLDMELLGYDFHLFTCADTGRDCVVFRENGRLALAEAVPIETVADAVRHLNASGQRFVFFVEAATGRGNVLYRRYDGHYGLITPAA